MVCIVAISAVLGTSISTMFSNLAGSSEAKSYSLDTIDTVRRKIHDQASRRLPKFVRDEDGASLVEYGLLLSLVAVVCIVAISTLGTTSPPCSPTWPA